MTIPKEVLDEAAAAVPKLPAKPEAKVEYVYNAEASLYHHTLIVSGDAKIKITNKGVEADGKQIVAFDPNDEGYKYIKVITKDPVYSDLDPLAHNDTLGLKPEVSRPTLDVSGYNDARYANIDLEGGSPTVIFGKDTRWVSVDARSGKPTFEVPAASLKDVEITRPQMEEGDVMMNLAQNINFNGTGRGSNEISIFPDNQPERDSAMIVTFNVVDGNSSRPVKPYFTKISGEHFKQSDPPQPFRSDEDVKAQLIAAMQEVLAVAQKAPAPKQAARDSKVR